MWWAGGRPRLGGFGVLRGPRLGSCAGHGLPAQPSAPSPPLCPGLCGHETLCSQDYLFWQQPFIPSYHLFPGILLCPIICSKFRNFVHAMGGGPWLPE